MTVLSYKSDFLETSGKQGKLQQDPDGYYDFQAGAFDAYNSAGAFYPLGPAQQFFEDASDFQRRIKSGRLYGEMDHPIMLPGMSREQFLMRIMRIEHKFTSHHIREAYLTNEEGFKNKDGQVMTMTHLRLKPTNERLGISLDNPHENTAMSIRSITIDRFDPRRGCMMKNMKMPVTWDWIPEPGIAEAGKYDHPGLESLNPNLTLNQDVAFEFTHQDVVNTQKFLSKTGLGMESGFDMAAIANLEKSIRPEPKPMVLGGLRKPRSARF